MLAGSSSTVDSTLFPQLVAGQWKVVWLPPACFSRHDLRTYRVISYNKCSCELCMVQSPLTPPHHRSQTILNIWSSDQSNSSIAGFFFFFSWIVTCRSCGDSWAAPWRPGGDRGRWGNSVWSPELRRRCCLKLSKVNIALVGCTRQYSYLQKHYRDLRTFPTCCKSLYSSVLFR